MGYIKKMNGIVFFLWRYKENWRRALRFTSIFRSSPSDRDSGVPVYISTYIYKYVSKVKHRIFIMGKNRICCHGLEVILEASQAFSEKVYSKSLLPGSQVVHWNCVALQEQACKKENLAILRDIVLHVEEEQRCSERFVVFVVTTQRWRHRKGHPPDSS